jgi:outer membrane protein assembly factor BamB
MGWFLIPLCLAASDWPQWLGPERNGVSREAGLLKQWPKAGPKLLWQARDLGYGYGAPAVAGGRLYLISNFGLDNESLIALSVEDGKRIWSTRLGNVGNPDQQPSYPAARSTPTVDGDSVFAMSSDGDVASLDAATGKVRWQKSVRKEFGGVPGKWAYAESPLIDGDTLVVSPGGAEATLVAVNKKTGQVIWKTAVPGGDAAAYASAIQSHAGGRKQYVQFLEKGVVGVDAQSGKFLWRYDQTSKGPANIPTPIANENFVYSTARSLGAAGLVRLNASADGVTAEQVYFERNLPCSIGGAVLVGRHLYGTNSQGLVAAEFASGKVLWQNESVGAGSILYADGHLYVHGEDGEVALVEASPESYKEKGRFAPPDRPAKTRGAREKSWAYPVVANGKLYIRDLGAIWCYDIRASSRTN